MWKKLNLFNKILLFCIVTMVGVNLFFMFQNKSWDRYYFDSSVTAPPSYPMHIENISFDYPNNEFGIEFYQSVDEVNTNRSTWGNAYYFPQVHTTMRLPTFLQLSYFDYRANKFYKTTIALPDDQIRSYFKEAEKGNHFTEIYNPKGNVKGLIFLLGIANNGNIMLWLRGENYAKLIFKKHLEPVSFSESYQYKETKSIETYKQIFFQNLSDSLRMNIESGFEEKANYIDSTKQFIESRL